MRTIELSIKKRMKRMNLTALLLGGVCLLCQLMLVTVVLIK